MKKLKEILKIVTLGITSFIPTFSMEREVNVVINKIRYLTSISSQEDKSTYLLFFDNKKSSDTLKETVEQFKEQIIEPNKNDNKNNQNNEICVKNHVAPLLRKLDLYLYQDLIRVCITEHNILSYEGLSFLEVASKLRTFAVALSTFETENILHTSFISFIAKVNLKDLNVDYSHFNDVSNILLNHEKMSRGNMAFFKTSHVKLNLSNKCNYNILAKCKDSSIIYTKYRNIQFKNNPREYNKIHETAYQEFHVK